MRKWGKKIKKKNTPHTHREVPKSSYHDLSSRNERDFKKKKGTPLNFRKEDLALLLLLKKRGKESLHLLA